MMGLSLKSYQQKIIEKSGLLLIDIEDSSLIKDKDYFSFEDDLFFTEGFLRICVQLSKNSKKSKRFFFEENSFNLRYLLPATENKDWSYAFYFHSSDSSHWEEILVPQKIFSNYIKIPQQICAEGKYHFDQCEVWITRIASPFHLLYANLALNFGRSIQTQKSLPLWAKETFFPYGSKPFFWALKRMNKIGKGCKIHSSAILEGVELGEGVTIGANCVVRMSKIEAGTTVEDNVTLNYSIIGKDNYISANNFINLCMTYENVYLIHGPYQFSIYGKNVAVMAVINCDFRLDTKSIVIPTDKGLVDSKQTLLGIAYGHGSVVGGGNIIAPGRIVPNGIKIAPPGQIIISKFDEYVGH